MREEVINDCRLILGDCRDYIGSLGSFDLLLTDPPYGIGKRSGTISKERNRNNYQSFDDTPENIQNEIIPAVELALSVCKRGIITPGGKCCFMYPPPVDIGMLYQPAAVGMTHWGRTTCQPVLFYGKDPKSGKTIQPIHFINNETPEKNDHPCPKPTGLMIRLLDRGSVAGESVLDPFMGSGTTGFACVNLGRKFTGIEKEQKYFDIACKRIEDAYRQQRLFA